jgi:hypothetical protein
MNENHFIVGKIFKTAIIPLTSYLSVLSLVFKMQCSSLKALGQQFNKTLSFCLHYKHLVLLVLLGLYDGFFFDCLYYLVKSLLLLAHF